MHEYELHLSWLEEQQEAIQSVYCDLEIYDELPINSINKEDVMSDTAFGEWEIEGESEHWEPSLFILTEIGEDK